MKFLLLISLGLSLAAAPERKEISLAELQDKIKGGWAGQVIGCTYGGPTEFRFNGRIIPDDYVIPWDDERCLYYFENFPGLYDDVYMDLTFVDVFEKEGLDAPASSHAKAFAYAEYPLWHANQAARYNILHGIDPPKSGHWLTNPHSEDIDFQIEADFAGLMSPGMVNTASDICDKIGHIMNYGDGYYGGVYMAAMYSLAFVSDDINYIVNEALKAIPAKSEFYLCMKDIIAWHKQYPNDWKKTWQECQDKWSDDIGCPDGVFADFNIDAKINAAYVIMGLLYGNGDFEKTLDISTRCGQDSDCNPASAGGILATVMGYEKIPAKWKAPLAPIEDIDFQYTTMSLNDVYSIGYKHALETLKKGGAKIKGDKVRFPASKIKPVALEIGFEGHKPISKERIGKTINSRSNNELTLEFEGIGFILSGVAAKADDKPDSSIKLELIIDGKSVEQFEMPTSSQSRRHDVAWRYNLPEGKHEVRIRILNPSEGYSVRTGDMIVYGAK